MDVGDWLRSLGLGQYETLFRQNDIDAEVLSELTEGDLEKFGVSFGHRKRLLMSAKVDEPAPVANGRFPPIADIGRGIAWGHAVRQKSATIAKVNGLRSTEARDSRAPAREAPQPSKPVEM